MPDTFDHAAIHAEAIENIGISLEAQQWWREYEVRENYAMRDGHQWDMAEYNRRTEDGLPIHTINKSAPVVDAVAGFEAQHQAEVDYIPRRVQDGGGRSTDIMGAVAAYVREDARINHRNSECFLDMLTCGLGAQELYISFDDNLSGEIESARVYPYMVGWDAASQEKNFTDGNYCFYARVVSAKTAQETIENAEDSVKVAGEAGLAGGTASAYDQEFLNIYDNVLFNQELRVIYSYHWREKQTFWRVENPFIERPGVPIGGLGEGFMAQYAMELSSLHQFDLLNDQYIILTSKRALGDVRKGFEFMGLPLEYSKSQRWRYYRCKIIGDHILDPAESFSQDGHALQFMVGKYDETRRCPYGMMRALKDPQRLYNSAISDIKANIESSPNGGVTIEETSVSDLAGFVDTYRKMRDVTVVADGALTGGRVQNKTPAQLNPSVAQMAVTMAADIPGVTGVTPAMMGQTGDGQDPSGVRYAREVRQSLYTLYSYFKARSFFLKQQGRQMIAAIRALAENMPYRAVYNMTGIKDAGDFLELVPDDLAEEYEVVVKEVPVSPDESAEVERKLYELAGTLAQAGMQYAVAPVISMAVQRSGLEDDDKQRIMPALRPPPPPQPDQSAVAMVQAEAAERMAAAEERRAKATLTRIETLKKQKELMVHGEAVQAEIAETQSETDLNKAKTLNEMRGY